MAAFLGVLALLSVASPLIVPDAPSLVGALLLVCALTETIHGVRRATLAAQRQAWGSAGITAGLSVLLLAAPFLAGAALVTFVAAWFALDAVRQGVFAWRARATPRVAGWALVAMAGNLVVFVLLGVFRSRRAQLAGGLRGCPPHRGRGVDGVHGAAVLRAGCRRDRARRPRPGRAHRRWRSVPSNSWTRKRPGRAWTPGGSWRSC